MGHDVPAATRTLRILRALAGGPLSASSLARRLGIPRSSTYQLLAAMADEGFVSHDAGQEKWNLGIAALEVGHAYLRHDPLELHARPVLTELVSALPPEIAAVAHCAVLHGRESLYVVTEHTARTTTTVAEIGVRLPASLTASGRSMLAVLPPSQVRALFPDRSAFVNRTGQGPMNLQDLRSLLRVERAAGIFCERGFITEGFTSVAVAIALPPVLGPAAIGLTMRSSQFTEPADYTSLLHDHADVISSRLGSRSAP
jgi:DNA-binding IclR family transcriptional regulator